MSPAVVHITTQELAAEFRVDSSTVRRWVEAGKVTPALTTPGGHHRFVLDDVKQELRTRSKTGTAAIDGAQA